ncbi:hypothetical protein C8R47DRAFT_1295781 [Mycena vitilis]|nr:hypothetical protein C8R47DRAFT_1295781 [Mycena vitilis]
MHRCLGIQEVVRLILTHLTPPFLSSEESRTLAALATTCTMFHEPALDILWRRQDTPINLLNCMPADLFDVRTTQQSHAGISRGIIRFRRPIMAADWDRPRHYMCRVKVLTLTSAPRFSLGEVYPTLLMCLPAGWLFPSLLELPIHCGVTAHQFSFLSMLSGQCPALEDVSIIVGPWKLPPAFQTSVSAFVLGLQTLKSLRIQGVDMPALAHIARLPNLRSLDLTTLPGGISASWASEIPVFQELQTLDLHHVTARSATAFLGVCLDAPLTSVYVSFASSPSYGDMKIFMTTLAACRHLHSSLTSAIFDTDHVIADEAVAINIDSLRALFCLRNLTCLQIELLCAWELDDGAISQMARAWPRLENLQVDNAESHPVSLPSLQCLPALAQHCPHLTSLKLTLDATAIPSQDSTVPRRVSQEVLTTLDVGRSPIYSSLSVARFISTIFPNIVYLHTSREHEDNDDEEEAEAIGFHRQWKEVQCQIPVLVAVREEGQLWGQNEGFDGTSSQCIVALRGAPSTILALRDDTSSHALPPILCASTVPYARSQPFSAEFSRSWTRMHAYDPLPILRKSASLSEFRAHSHMRSIGPISPSLTRIELASIAPKDLVDVVTHCPLLTHFKVSVSKSGDAPNADIILALHLESLSLSGYGLDVLNLPGLRRLEIEDDKCRFSNFLSAPPASSNTSLCMLITGSGRSSPAFERCLPSPSSSCTSRWKSRCILFITELDYPRFISVLDLLYRRSAPYAQSSSAELISVPAWCLSRPPEPMFLAFEGLFARGLALRLRWEEEDRRKHVWPEQSMGHNNGRGLCQDKEKGQDLRRALPFPIPCISPRTFNKIFSFLINLNFCRLAFRMARMSKTQNVYQVTTFQN